MQIEEFVGVLLRLMDQGVHNINLVTPTPWRTLIQEALVIAKKKGLSIPILWNTSGYETIEAIRSLSNTVDIWLTDIKFFSPALSAKVANAPDYFERTSVAVTEMIKESGPPVYDEEGMLQRGTIIRLLVLPGYREDAKNILRWMSANLPPDYIISIMNQYTPVRGASMDAPLNRRLTSFEYQDVVETAVSLGVTQGYMQQRGSALEAYTPPFDLTGL